MDVRGRNELAESILGRARAAMSRPIGVRAESDMEVVMRLAARRALEGIILEILAVVCVITRVIEIKVNFPFLNGEAFGHWCVKASKLFSNERL
jgi:hypothetical protein